MMGDDGGEGELVFPCWGLGAGFDTAPARVNCVAVAATAIAAAIACCGNATGDASCNNAAAAAGIVRGQSRSDGEHVELAIVS